MHPSKRFGLALAAFCFVSQAKADAVRLYVTDAHVIVGSNWVGIYVRLTDLSQLVFFKFSKENLNKRIALKVDGRVLVSPIVRTPIPAGLGEIGLNISEEEATEMARQLNSGNARLEVEEVPE